MSQYLLHLLLLLLAWCGHSTHAQRRRNYDYRNMYMRSAPGGVSGDGVQQPPRRSKCQLEIACRDSKGSRDSSMVRLPIRGPTGPPGPPGLPGQRGIAGEPGKPGIPGKSPSLPAKVSFFAHLGTNTLKAPKVSQKVLFDDVVTNEGNAYDYASGVFTAPVSGVYQIFVKIAAQGRKRAAVDCMQHLPDTGKSKRLFALWAESLPWATTSNQAVVKLPRGGQVWVEFRPKKNHWYLHGYTYSSFSGFLVYEDKN